jgi:hypothetical protein
LSDFIPCACNPGNLKIKKDSARLKYGVSGRPTLEFSICHFSFNCVIDAKPRGKLVTACIIEMIENIHNISRVIPDMYIDDFVCFCIIVRLYTLCLQPLKLGGPNDVQFSKISMYACIGVTDCSNRPSEQFFRRIRIMCQS